jgi:hypothetical protein
MIDAVDGIDDDDDDDYHDDHDVDHDHLLMMPLRCLHMQNQ